jgi:hypothetical protein
VKSTDVMFAQYTAVQQADRDAVEVSLHWVSVSGRWDAARSRQRPLPAVWDVTGRR